MKRTIQCIVCLLALSAAPGCHGSMGSAEGFGVVGPGGRDGAAGRILSRRMGSVDVLSFMAVLDTVLVRKYGFEIKHRAEHLNQASYETEWDARTPSAEEAAEGITNTRHRVVLRGLRLDTSTPSDSTVLFRMTMTVEHEVQTVSDAGWHPGEALDEAFLERIRAMDADLAAEAGKALQQ